jgi:hypothetical protein
MAAPHGGEGAAVPGGEGVVAAASSGEVAAAAPGGEGMAVTRDGEGRRSLRAVGRRHRLCGTAVGLHRRERGGRRWCRGFFFFCEPMAGRTMISVIDSGHFFPIQRAHNG